MIVNFADPPSQAGVGAALPLLLRLLAELPGDGVPTAERQARRQDIRQHRVTPGKTTDKGRIQ